MSNTRVPPRRSQAGNKGRPKGGQQRQQQRRRSQYLIGGAILAAVVVVAIVLAVSLGGSSKPAPLRTLATPKQFTAITSVPNSALTAPEVVAEVPRLYPAGPPVTNAQLPSTLTKDGKPTLLYIGAEFCPICATERWPMIIALSRFGHFDQLQTTRSAADDGNVPTWSFYQTTYTSPYLNFQPYEVETRTRATLENPPAQAQAIWSGYFSAQGQQESFPFIDFNQQFVLATSQFGFESLANLPFNQVLDAVGNNNTTIGNEIDAAAAAFTKYICMMTNNQPSSVCSAFSNVPATVQSASGGNGSSTAGG